jgi:hypothetical protein
MEDAFTWQLRRPDKDAFIWQFVTWTENAMEKVINL